MLALCNDAELRKYVPLLLIILLGTCLRIHNLGEKSLWLDEAASVFDAQVLIPSLTERLLTSQGEVKWQILQSIAQEWKIHQPSHPPFYFVLQRWGMAIGRCEFILRFLAVSIGIVSFPVLYRLAKDLFNEKVGFLSTLLLATSPLHVYYSREARMYTLNTLLVLVSAYCVVHFLRAKAWNWRIGYVISIAMAFLNVVALTFACRQKDKKRLLKWIAMQVGVLLLFVPWMPVAWLQITSGDGMAANQPLSLLEFSRTLYTMLSIGFHSGSVPGWVKAIVLPGFATFFLCGLIVPGIKDVTRGRIRWQISPETILCLLYFAALAVLLFSWRKPPFAARMGLFGIPAYYMIVARGMESIRIGTKAYLAIVAVLILLLLFPITINIYQRGPQEDWRGTVDYIVTRLQPDDVVVLNAHFIHIPFSYYAEGRISTYSDLRDVNKYPQNVPAMIANATGGHKRLWLVLSHTQYEDPEHLVKAYLVPPILFWMKDIRLGLTCTCTS